MTQWTLCGNSIKGELRKARGLDAADLQQVTTVKGEPPVRVQVSPGAPLTPENTPRQPALCRHHAGQGRARVWLSMAPPPSEKVPTVVLDYAAEKRTAGPPP